VTFFTPEEAHADIRQRSIDACSINRRRGQKREKTLSCFDRGWDLVVKRIRIVCGVFVGAMTRLLELRRLFSLFDKQNGKNEKRRIVGALSSQCLGIKACRGIILLWWCVEEGGVIKIPMRQGTRNARDLAIPRLLGNPLTEHGVSLQGRWSGAWAGDNVGVNCGWLVYASGIWKISYPKTFNVGRGFVDE